MVQRHVLQCGLCRNKDKCLKPGLKCVNRWSSSTVQRKRVPESWSSNRETEWFRRITYRNRSLADEARMILVMMMLLIKQQTLSVVNMMPSSPCWRCGSIRSSMKCISAARCWIQDLTTINWNKGNKSSMLHWYSTPRFLCTTCSHHHTCRFTTFTVLF